MATEPRAETLPREERVRKRRDFLEAYSSGTKTHSRHAVVFVASNGFGHPRLGITVTRRIGNAVTRNRLKRVTREIYRKTLRDVVGRERAVDLIVNMKRSAVDATYAELERDLGKAVSAAISKWRRAG